jgi:AcrR family transcriptional regulator
MRSQPLAEGLRARKKKQTRQCIAAVAARLFQSRGYENIRMVDIAHEANVSEQTLYNYFPTKEHLIFDMDQEFEAKILAIVINRTPKTSLTKALRFGAIDFLNEISHSVGKQTGVPSSVATGPELRRVWIEMNARHADALAEALLHEKGTSISRSNAKFVARSIVAIFAVIMEGLGEGIIAGKTRASIVKALRSDIESILDQVEHGFRP